MSFSLLIPTVKPAIATGVYNMPPVDPNVHVYDEAKLFSRLTTGQLEKKIKAIANAQNINVNYVTFRRLDYGETIESFTKELFTFSFSGVLRVKKSQDLALCAGPLVNSLFDAFKFFDGDHKGRFNDRHALKRRQRF